MLPSNGEDFRWTVGQSDHLRAARRLSGRCEDCGEPFTTKESQENGRRTCDTCRAEERSLDHHYIARAKEQAEELARRKAERESRPRRSAIYHGIEFDIIWDGIGSLPCAGWSTDSR